MWVIRAGARRRKLKDVAGGSYEAALIAIADAQARVFLAEAELRVAQMDLVQAYAAWSVLPAKLTILVEGKEPRGMTQNVNDVQLFVAVVAHDAANRVVPDPDALTYTVCDPASDLTTQNPSNAATVAPDPNLPGDNSHQQVNVTPADATTGEQANFRIFVTDGTRSAITDELQPTPGGATSIEIGVSQQ